jgi:hypothetical protein
MMSGLELSPICVVEDCIIPRHEQVYWSLVSYQRFLRSILFVDIVRDVLGQTSDKDY